MAANAARSLAEPQSSTPQKQASSQTRARKATLTSKGQITIPAEIRRELGMNAGDQLVIEPDAHGSVRVRKAEKYPFEKFLGIGTGVPELEAGPESIIQYFREARGHDEFDHLD